MYNHSKRCELREKVRLMGEEKKKNEEKKRGGEGEYDSEEM